MLKNLKKIAFPKLIFFEISPEQVDILKKLAEKYAKGYHYEFICDMNKYRDPRLKYWNDI